MHCRDAGVSIVVRGAVISDFMSRELDLYMRVRHFTEIIKAARRKSNAWIWV